MAQNTETILLVDDDALILKVCAEALELSGYEVVPVGTGQEALQAFAERPFSGAVVDLVLPDIDGLTILGALCEADSDIVVILMTGHASLDSAIEAVRRGAYDYLRKPFTATELARVVARGLEQRRLSVHNRELLQELDVMNRDLTVKVKQATEEITAFISLGRRLDQTDGPLPVLLDLLRAARQLTGAGSAALFGGSATGGLRCLAAEGPGVADVRSARLGKDSLLQQCLCAEKPLIVQDLLADPEHVTDSLALLGLNSVMAVPLVAVSGLVGVMGLFDAADQFTERQASLVKVIAAQAAEVVALAKLNAPAAPEPAEAAEFVDLQEFLAAG